MYPVGLSVAIQMSWCLDVNIPPSPAVIWQTSPFAVQCASGNNGEYPGTVMFCPYRLGMFSYQTSASGENYTPKSESAKRPHNGGELTRLMMKNLGAMTPALFSSSIPVDRPRGRRTGAAISGANLVCLGPHPPLEFARALPAADKRRRTEGSIVGFV